MVERGVQKETVMLQLEMLIRFPDSTFAERQQLLSLSERADGDRPFFESNRHFYSVGVIRIVRNARRKPACRARPDSMSDLQNHQILPQIIATDRCVNQTAQSGQAAAPLRRRQAHRT